MLKVRKKKGTKPERIFFEVFFEKKYEPIFSASPRRLQHGLHGLWRLRVGELEPRHGEHDLPRRDDKVLRHDPKHVDRVLSRQLEVGHAGFVPEVLGEKKNKNKEKPVKSTQ